jgi:flagellar hook assembly protein FlgD
VYIINQSEKRIATVARSRFMKAALYPYEVPTVFTWNGREQNGSAAPDGDYYFAVDLLHQGRVVTISNEAGPLPVVVNNHARCP